MALELKSTNHSYYCSDTNYYVGGRENYGRNDFDTWASFKNEWICGDELDDDLNHLFRFDIYENTENPGNFCLYLFFLLQRKGIYRPVYIEHITSEDMPEIEAFLRDRWAYMQHQWKEFSNE